MITSCFLEASSVPLVFERVISSDDVDAIHLVSRRFDSLRIVTVVFATRPGFATISPRSRS